MVTIRLTEDEFHQIRAHAAAAGAPSVSEFTRAAIHALLRDAAHHTPPPLPGPVEHRFASIHARLQALEARLATLTENHNDN